MHKQSGIFQNRKELTLSYNGDGVLDLIEQMLKINPMERIRMKHILQHPWLKNGWCSNTDISYDNSCDDANVIDSNLIVSPETMAATIYSKDRNKTKKFHEITNEKIERLDNDILDECLRLHSNEVNDVLELRSNILYKHCYHTATYWLIHQNSEYYHKVLYIIVADLFIFSFFLYCIFLTIILTLFIFFLIVFNAIAM